MIDEDREIKWTMASFIWKVSHVAMKIQNRSRKVQMLTAIFISTVVSTGFYLLMYEKLDEDIYNTSPLHADSLRSSNVGCVFPSIDAHSAAAMKYDRDMPRVACHGTDWVGCNMSECYVKKEILDAKRDVWCIYKDIIYIDDHNYKVGDGVKLAGHQKYVLNESDYFKVSCFGYDKWGFGLLSRRWQGYKAGIRPVKESPKNASPGNGLNVLILGFDSTSRNGFVRKMPKSYKTLIEELGGVVLEGYNIVGEGTPDALFPILSGKQEWQHPSARKAVTDNRLDPDMFIFRTVKDHGYRTSYYEDMPWIGSFQYRYNGFNKSPADHYLRPFLMEETQAGTKWWTGTKRRYCIGDTPQYGVILNLTKQLMNIRSSKFCFTFIADISHDDFNMISTADDDLVEFMRYLKSSGTLDDTLFILMGDHGPRFSPMRRHTYQGKMEERLPLMSLTLPSKLKIARPAAIWTLRANSKVLTTPFDIHTTVLDAIGLKHYASNYTVKRGGMLRGMSLLEPVPPARTCADAAILPHWCSCTNVQCGTRPRPAPAPLARAFALFVNDATAPRRALCAERRIISIESVACTNSTSSSPRGSVYYQLTVVMSPGAAVYEATIAHSADTDAFLISDSDISRISAYGSEPACLNGTMPQLDKYCFCVKHS